MSSRARTQSRRHHVVVGCASVLLVGAAMLASLMSNRAARAAIAPDQWAPEPSGALVLTTVDAAQRQDAAEEALPASLNLDTMTPERLHDRIEALGWVFVLGKERASESAQSHSSTWVIAHPPGIDAVVTLYRFESQAYLEAVLPFVEAQDEVQIARGERTLLYTRIRRNPERAQQLLAELQRP